MLKCYTCFVFWVSCGVGMHVMPRDSYGGRGVVASLVGHLTSRLHLCQMANMIKTCVENDLKWNDMIWNLCWNILKYIEMCWKLRDGTKCSSVCCNTLGLKRWLEAPKSWQMWQLGWLICQTDRPSSAANLEHDHRKSWFETRIEMPAVGSRFYNCWSGDPHFTCRSWAAKPAILTGLDSLDKKEIHKVNMDDTIFTIFIGYGKHMETFEIFLASTH